MNLKNSKTSNHTDGTAHSHHSSLGLFQPHGWPHDIFPWLDLDLDWMALSLAWPRLPLARGRLKIPSSVMEGAWPPQGRHRPCPPLRKRSHLEKKRKENCHIVDLFVCSEVFFLFFEGEINTCQSWALSSVVMGPSSRKQKSGFFRKHYCL